jgi:DNA mismatch repair ATPase MutL
VGRPFHRRLERSLDEATLQDLVARAVEGMKTASDRLTDAKDPGLGTQRVQEEVVRTLDRLLEEAQKQQGKKKSSSSSSSSKQKKEGEKSQDPSEKNGQQQKPSKSQQQQQNDASKSGENNESANNQTRGDEVAQGGELSESRIEWGKLPERVRELVLQGRRDRVSSIYERLTREYYRRLAEEASR